MTSKRIKISPYLTISAITLLYILLSGLTMFVIIELEDYSFKYVIAFFEILLFTIITYRVNKYYFKKINLTPPSFISLNTTLFISILIGISIAFVEVVPYRIYAIIKTGMFEYIFIAITIENFLKALGAGITEEIIARGTLLNFFKQKNKKYLGLVISSLLFGLMHITNAFVGMEISLIYIVYMIVAGFTLGFIYLNFGIYAVITTHIVGNILISGFTTPTRYGFYYGLAINGLICIWLFFRDRRNQIKARD